MAAETEISWSDATWNPTVGCTKVSAGCDHCYAETLVNRFAGHNSGFPNRFDVMTLRGEKTLGLPLRWRDPKRIFVNSLSDLFHDDVPDEFIAKVFTVMALAQRHTFQLLTKRHARMRSLLSSERFALLVEKEWSKAPSYGTRLRERAPHPASNWPLPNVWLGVSVENQQWADIRIPALLDTPAAVRFLSCEPLLGPVDLTHMDVERHTRDMYWINALTGRNRDMDRPCRDVPSIDWVIAGGESGPGARPMRVDWPRALRDQCAVADVPFHFKQWGEHAPYDQMTEAGRRLVEDRTQSIPSDNDVVERRYIHRVGKRAAGRELDGRAHDEFPQAVPQ